MIPRTQSEHLKALIEDRGFDIPEGTSHEQVAQHMYRAISEYIIRNAYLDMDIPDHREIYSTFMRACCDPDTTGHYHVPINSDHICIYRLDRMRHIYALIRSSLTEDTDEGETAGMRPYIYAVTQLYLMMEEMCTLKDTYQMDCTHDPEDVMNDYISWIRDITGVHPRDVRKDITGQMASVTEPYHDEIREYIDETICTLIPVTEDIMKEASPDEVAALFTAGSSTCYPTGVKDLYITIESFV